MKNKYQHEEQEEIQIKKFTYECLWKIENDDDFSYNHELLNDPEHCDWDYDFTPMDSNKKYDECKGELIVTDENYNQCRITFHYNEYFKWISADKDIPDAWLCADDIDYTDYFDVEEKVLVDAEKWFAEEIVEKNKESKTIQSENWNEVDFLEAYKTINA